jgi:tetratricopeptide (TPR) repeat protein
MRALLTAGALVPVFLAGLLATPQRRFDRMMAEELAAAYYASGPDVLKEAFPTVQRFEAFRKDLYGLLNTWRKSAREPKRALFILEVALVAEGRHYLYWADVLELGHQYLRERELPGNNPRMDAFELLWTKTTLAFLEGRRDPVRVQWHVSFAGRNIAAEPRTTRPAIVDPWIALTWGYAHEGFVIADAARFAKRVTRALESYGVAAKYETTRAEALVRTAGLQLRSDRPADALATLNRFDERWTQDGVLIFWARVLRGKALDALDRAEESLAAYRGALEIAPSAQSPIVGMMLVEFRRGRDDAADALSKRVRMAPDPVADPWWLYPHGELRVFKDRLAALREMAK